MSAVALLQTKITETDTLIRKHEHAIVNHPEQSMAISYGLHALVKERKQLELSFEKEVAASSYEVCRYRLFSDYREPVISAVTSVMGEFQHLVSLAFHALNRGVPLTKGIAPPDVIAKTSFGFGYSYRGSVGIALTIASDPMLFDDMSSLDSCVDAIFSLAGSHDVEHIRAMSEKLGKPVIRSAYKWASEQMKHGVCSDVTWCRKGDVRSRLVVQRNDLERFINFVELMGDEQQSEFSCKGVLVEAGIQPKSFKLAPDGQNLMIHGTFDDAISSDHKVEIPGNYSFKIRRTATMNYSTGEEKERYFLVSVDPA